MTGVDIEVARAALVIGLILSAVLYNRTRLVSGGAVTGAYLALMLISGHYTTILGWFILSLLGLAAIKLAANRWPLPRAWLYAIGIAVPATLHVLGMYLSGFDFLGDYSSYLAAGLYVTNGLTAYDAQRQGLPRTLIGVGIVTVATYLVLLPVAYGMSQVRDIVEYSAPVLQNPLTVLGTILIALAVRTGLGWGTAGIVGALFFVDLLNVASVVVVIVMTVVGTLIYRAVEKPLGLTPRQRHYSILAVGAIVSWFGLFWAEWLGVPGAELAYQFGVEPLLFIGLMIAETMRSGPAKMFGGTAIVVAVTLGLSLTASMAPQFLWLVFLAVVAVSAVLIIRAIGPMRGRWYAALAAGAQHSPTA